MKVLMSILALSFVVAIRANAADFQSSATYCNGPIPGGDVSTCPAFSQWMGVSLKDLKLVSLPTAVADSNIRLEDASGHVWNQQLATCQSKITDPRGCKATIDTSKPKQISIQVETWEIGQSADTLFLSVHNGNQLTVLSSQGDQLIFALTSK